MHKKIMILVVSLIIYLLAGEVIFHLLDLPREVDKKYDVQSYQWYQHYVRLNSQGYRDNEYQTQKPPNTLRIFTTGDSFSFGLFIQHEKDVYPQLLEQALPSKVGKKVEVINGAFPGFSIYDEVNRFLWQGKKYQPDLVVLSINFDEVNVKGFSVAYAEQHIPTWLQKSRWYQLTLGSFLRKQAEDKYYDYMMSVYKDPTSPAWQEFSKEVLKLKDSIEKMHGKLAIIVFPVISSRQPNAPYTAWAYDQRFAQFGKNHGIFIIDPVKQVVADPHREKLIVSPTDSHPTEKMNQITAQEFLGNSDVMQYLRTKSPTALPEHTVAITDDNSVLPVYSGISSVESTSGESYLYYEENPQQFEEFPSPGISDRQIPFFADSIVTGPNHKQGPELLYHLYPVKPGRLVIPKTIYGYRVVGVNTIISLNNRNNTPTELQDVRVIANSGNDANAFVITYSPKPYQEAFLVHLALSKPVVVIRSDRTVSSVLMAITKHQIIPTQTQTVSIPLEQPITYLPKFSTGSGPKRFVCFIDGVMVPVAAMSMAKDKLTLSFPQKLHKGQMISVMYYASEPIAAIAPLTVTLY